MLGAKYLSNKVKEIEHVFEEVFYLVHISVVIEPPIPLMSSINTTLVVYDTTAEEVNECLMKVKDRMSQSVNLEEHKISCQIVDIHLVENKEYHQVQLPLSFSSFARDNVVDEFKKLNWA